MTTTAEPSASKIPLSISGVKVGLLDPTQADRLLSSPDSVLSFATFHPRTAGAHWNIDSPSGQKLTTREALCNSKRVVIENISTGESFWRWVPRAGGVDSTEDEGQWPRVIEICGQLVNCSQEQWDIYKLDPNYDCFVQPPPKLTTITLKKGTGNPSKGKPRAYTNGQGRSTKRRMRSPASESMVTSEMENAKKSRRHARVESDNDADDDSEGWDEDEVASMIIDDGMSSTSVEYHNRVKQRRRKVEQDRAQRREKLSAHTRTTGEDDQDLHEDLSMIDLTLSDDEDESEDHLPTPKASEEPNHFTFKRSAGDEPEQYRKRTRTGSPTRAREHLAHKRRERDKKLKGKFNQRVNGWREHQQQQLLRDLYGSASHFQGAEPDVHYRKLPDGSYVRVNPQFANGGSSSYANYTSNGHSNGYASQSHYNPHYHSPHTHSRSHDSNDHFHEDPVSLEEKIRRMTELNAYEQARAAKEQQRRKAAEAEAEQQRKAEELRARLEKEHLEKMRAEQERLREEERHRQQHRWSYGAWTSQRAMERYKALSEEFDAAKFSPENPITFIDIPWPVLLRPTLFNAQDVDWNAVEAFFEAVKMHMRGQDYKIFVEKSHRRFHPDRWRARRVLQSIANDEDRALLEVAANTVAQAITPLWREVKGG